MQRRQDFPYRLTAELDGGVLLQDSVAPRGARADRPLSLFRELALPVGRHRVVVRFEPYGPWPALALDTTLALAPRQVVVVTVDDAGQLAVRGRSGPAKSAR